MTVNDRTYSATIGVQYIKRSARRFDRALNHHPLPGTPRRRGLHRMVPSAPSCREGRLDAPGVARWCVWSSPARRSHRSTVEKSSHQLAARDSQHRTAVANVLLAEHFQAHPRSASQPIETAMRSVHADRPRLQLSIKARGARTQSWTVRWCRKKCTVFSIHPCLTPGAWSLSLSLKSREGRGARALGMF